MFHSSRKFNACMATSPGNFTVQGLVTIAAWYEHMFKRDIYSHKLCEVLLSVHHQNLLSLLSVYCYPGFCVFLSAALHCLPHLLPVIRL